MRNQILVLIPLLLFFAGCGDGKEVNVYVFTSIEHNEALELVLDDRAIGQIPYVDTTRADDVTKKARLIPLKPGRHEISVKDKYGSYLSSVIVEISQFEMNMGPLNYSKNQTKTYVVKNQERYEFKSRSFNEGYVFSLD